MASTVTVTGKYGPELTATATVLSGVTSFSIDVESEVLTVFYSSKVAQYDISAATTLTLTVVAPRSYTLTIS